MTDPPPKQNRVRFVGAAAGIVSGLTKVAVGHSSTRDKLSALWHSFDTIKTRLQCSPPGTYSGALDCLLKTVRNESVWALYKGALPPALGWSLIDSVLLGSLHNYRLLLIRQGFTEKVVSRSSKTGVSEVERLTLTAHGVAGLCAGVTSALVATPVELLKVKLQMQLQRSASDRQFRGPLDCMRQIVRAQGALGLWTGFTGSLAFRSNFFWMFLGVEGLMRGFGNLGGTRYEIGTGLSNFLSGGLASFLFWSFAIPADNIKNRQMAAPLSAPRQSFVAVAKNTYRQSGAAGFYRGLVPTLLRAFPTNASAYFAYEMILAALSAEKTRH